MPSINKVILIGHLGRDPESRYLPSGETVCNFSIATSDAWKDKATGERKDLTEWNRISAFGRLAEVCGEFLKKGAMVYIEGSLRTRKWQDKDGNDRYTTEIRANEMKMLGGRAAQDGGDGRSVQDGGEGPAPDPAAKAKPVQSGFDDMDDDIPF